MSRVWCSLWRLTLPPVATPSFERRWRTSSAASAAGAARGGCHSYGAEHGEYLGGCEGQGDTGAWPWLWLRRDAMLMLIAIVAAIVTALLGSTVVLAAEQETVAFSTMLPNVHGQHLTAVVVSYAPGGTSHVHRHAGSVFAYVLSGAIRSENSATGSARVYNAGESFFEPPGSTHLISENASKIEPASLLAVFVAPDGATLTKPAE
jgi:quercetin dioxygenase-like cupin family protein